MDFINQLPAELLIKIFKHRSNQLSLSQVSKRFLNIFDEFRVNLTVESEEECLALDDYLLLNPIQVEIYFPITKIKSLTINLIQRLFYAEFIAGTNIIKALLPNLDSLTINISPSYTRNDNLLVSNCAEALGNALIGKEFKVKSLVIRGRCDAGILSKIDSVLAQTVNLEYLELVNADVSIYSLAPIKLLPLHSLIITISNQRQHNLLSTLIKVSSSTLKHLSISIQNLATGSLKFNNLGLNSTLLPVASILESLSLTDKSTTKKNEISISDQILSVPFLLLKSLDIDSECCRFEFEPISSLLKLVLSELDVFDFNKLAKLVNGCNSLQSIELPIWFSTSKYQGGIKKFGLEQKLLIENYCKNRAIKLIWTGEEEE